jgi:hypothetical protein
MFIATFRPDPVSDPSSIWSRYSRLKVSDDGTWELMGKPPLDVAGYSSGSWDPSPFRGFIDFYSDNGSVWLMTFKDVPDSFQTIFTQGTYFGSGTLFHDQALPDDIVWVAGPGVPPPVDSDGSSNN